MDSPSSNKITAKINSYNPSYGSIQNRINISAGRLRPASPDSAFEHEGEWVMESILEPDEITSDLSEESNGKTSFNMTMNGDSVKSASHDHRTDTTVAKSAAAQDSDVDSGIVACRKPGERIGSTSSADTDSSQESRPRNEYSTLFHKNEPIKARSHIGSLRIPRRSSYVSPPGPAKGDHLALKECNRRPPTPLSIFPDSHHCVRFDEQIQLSEQNIRRSCRKLFATLYAQRFSYPSHQDNSSIHGRSDSLDTRLRSRTAPELELRRYSPATSELSYRHSKSLKENCSPAEIQRLGSSSRGSHRTVHKSISDASLSGKILPSSNCQLYKSQCKDYANDFQDNGIVHTTSTDSGLGSLRNSTQCTCHNRPTSLTGSSQCSNIPTCTCTCCNCHQQFPAGNTDNPSKLFKSSSCSTLSSTLSHQSRPQLTQFPPRTLRKVMSHSDDKTKSRTLQKTSSCSNLLDGPSGSYHIANVPIYNDNMVQVHARIASVIPDDLKSNASSQGGRRAKTLSRLRYTSDGSTNSCRLRNSYLSHTSENSRCMGRRDLQINVIPPHTETMEAMKPRINIEMVPEYNKSSSEAETKSIASTEIYSQIADDTINSFDMKSPQDNWKNQTLMTERPKSVGVIIPNRGPSSVHLKSALKKPTQSAVIQINDLPSVETQVKGILEQPTEVEYAIVDKTKKNRFASLPTLNGNASLSQNNVADADEKDPPVPPKKTLHKSDFSLYHRSRSSSPKKSLLEKMQSLTKNAKTALQKAFSTERIYRPEREERMEGQHQKGLQRSKSFIRNLAGSFRKKKRKRPLTAEVLPNLNTEWNDQNGTSTEVNVLGQLLQLNLDGSQVVELTKPPTKPYGFFVARGRVRNSKGVFVSRMRDQETQKQLAGLLDIGDEILEIDGVPVKDSDIIEVNRLMANKNTILLTVLPYICRKDI